MAEPKVAYVITEGSYSDYHVLGVTLDKATAEAWTAKGGRWPLADIEEFDVFSGPVPTKLPYLEASVCGIDSRFLMHSYGRFDRVGYVKTREGERWADEDTVEYASTAWFLEGLRVGFEAKGTDTERVRKAVTEAQAQMRAQSELLDRMALLWLEVTGDTGPRARIKPNTDMRFIAKALEQTSEAKELIDLVSKEKADG